MFQLLLDRKLFTDNNQLEWLMNVVTMKLFRLDEIGQKCD